MNEEQNETNLIQAKDTAPTTTTTAITISTTIVDDDSLKNNKKPCTFFKKKSDFGKKKNRKNFKRKKSATPSPTNSDGSGSGSGSGSDGERNHSSVVHKQRKVIGGLKASSLRKDLKSSNVKKALIESGMHTTYKSDRSAKSALPSDMGATATSHIDSETLTSATNSAFADNHQQVTDRSTCNNKLGKTAVSSYIRPGPQKASGNIRASVRWDYAPDVCKDYKETGYCGFGDTCKFMHDRGDYKMGWQLDKEYESGNYNKGAGNTYEVESSDDDSEDDVPFACYICRKPFTDPVVTKCKHYFCMQCALNHMKKSKKCFVCNALTNGIFNSARDVLAKQDIQVETTALNDG